ncbi:MAG: SDR family oxidoreductase [Archangium sp.]|nr:SDR family oxidoreductase [Archangium sp.]
MTNTPIALITGGSRGLGKSMAEHLATHGVDVIVTYHSAEAEAAQVVRTIEGKGRKAVALRLDVRATDGFGAFVTRVSAALEKTWQRTQLNFVVNNAGTAVHASFAETTEAQFDEMVNVHLKSTFFLTQKLLPLVADGGRVLNMSTGLARFTKPGYAAYATMKGGVETLTRYMALELAARKITVNVIAPGAIATDFAGGLVRDNPAVNTLVASTVALGRVGEADDIGAAVAALLSPELAFMTAQRIEVSGGTSL